MTGPWPKLSIKTCLTTITREIANDPSYAWGWYCNIKMAFVDEGGDKLIAAFASRRFMQQLFNVDIATLCPDYWKTDLSNALGVVDVRLCEHNNISDNCAVCTILEGI